MTKLNDATWYEDGLHLWWSDLEVLRKHILDSIYIMSMVKDEQADKVLAEARLLLQELGIKHATSKH